MTRADGAQWQKLAQPGQSKWKQVRDGDKKPQSYAKANPIEGAGGALDDVTTSALGYKLTQAKYDLDGFMPPDELHPDHVDVDEDGDIDNKPVLSWTHEGRENRTYTMNFHQRKHRQQFAALQQHAESLGKASAKLGDLYQQAPANDRDRYLVAQLVVETGHSPDQLLALQHGHVGRSLQKGKAKMRVLMPHASGTVFNWDTGHEGLRSHYTERKDRSPTSPLFSCGPDCVASALDEAGLGDVPVSVMRAHAQARMATDMLAKSKRYKLDGFGAGLDKVRGNIIEASNKIAQAYGHPIAPPSMCYVPPHVQAAYIEGCGGGEVFKNTFAALNGVRKSVRTEEESIVWQHVEEQILKSKPPTLSETEVVDLVKASFERLMSKPSSPRLKAILTKSTTEKETSPPPTENPQPTEMKQAESTPSSELPTTLTTPSTESTAPTQKSDSPEPPPISSSTSTMSASPTDSPIAVPTSGSAASDTSGPSLESLSCLQTETSSQESETLTRSSLSSVASTTSEISTGLTGLWASIVTKYIEGVIAPSGFAYFDELFKGATTPDGAHRFILAVAEFAAAVVQHESLMKAGSVAGTRGDPVGKVSVHTDGSRWRKTGPGAWERVGDVPEGKKAQGKQQAKDTVRVAVLRQRLKQLRQRWASSTSTSQRADVVRQLTTVKQTIRQLTGAKLKKSMAPEEEIELSAVALKVDCLLSDWQAELDNELIAKGDGFVPPASVRAAARRGLELRRKHKRGGLDNKEAKKQGVGSGVQRASNLANGHALSLQTVKRMRAFFSRHAQHGEHRQDKTSAAYISWLLWGGNAGRSWANKVVREAEAKQKRISKSSVVADIVNAHTSEEVRTFLMTEYIRETDHYDLHKSLTAPDYIERILVDGGTTAADTRLYIYTHGAGKLVKFIEATLAEVRNGV